MWSHGSNFKHKVGFCEKLDEIQEMVPFLLMMIKESDIISIEIGPMIKIFFKDRCNVFSSWDGHIISVNKSNQLNVEFKASYKIGN